MILCFGLIYSSASAENWIDIKKPVGDNTLISVDLNTLKPYKGALPKNSNTKHKYVSIITRLTPVEDHINLKYNLGYAETHTIINCSDYTSAIKVWLNSVDKNRRVVDWNKVISPNDLIFVISDSRFSQHNMEKTVCTINNLIDGRTYS